MQEAPARGQRCKAIALGDLYGQFVPSAGNAVYNMGWLRSGVRQELSSRLVPSVVYLSLKTKKILSMTRMSMQGRRPASRVFFTATGLCSLVVAVLVIAPSAASSASAAAAPKVTAITASQADTCALTSVGAAYCWGSNGSLQLGDGDGTAVDSDAPVAVSGLSSGVTAITAGGATACALTSAGSVECWGWNDDGELGDGTTTDSDTPVAVSSLTSGVTAISAGYGHTCAVTSGAAVCWGDNKDGELGDGTDTQSDTPVAVSGLSSGVTAISASNGHNCALTSAGGVKCWGYNSDGELGDGTTTDSDTPVAVTGLSSGVTAITAGEDHTCAVTTAGAAECWGANEYGQLGDGTTTASDTPVAVSGLSSGVVAVTAGDSYTCALTSADGVECWGYNFDGELGDGTSTGPDSCGFGISIACSLTPVGVTGLSGGVTAIAAGDDHTCAVTSAGVAECWGGNNGLNRDLGDCSDTDSSTPVDVGDCSQAISWGQQGPYTFGQAPVVLDATASSGLAVGYTVISGPCTVSGSTLTLTRAGSCVVDADQSGNLGYSAAATVSQTITITSARSITISSGTGAPKDTAPPVITGPASAGHTLRCSTGTWANAPTGYAYQWYRDGTPLAGASASTYTLKTLDEGTTLTCVVTAFNAAGQASATSNAVTIPIPHVPRCPGATGVMTGTSIGQIELGMTRARAEYLYRRHSDRGKQYEDFFCLTPIGVRVGYATPKLFRILTEDEQRQLKRRVVWASTSNPNYELHGVRPGESLADASSQLKNIAPPFHIGPNYWYLARGARYTAVLKVRGGIVQELGIAENALTRTRSAQKVLMHSFY